MRVIFFECYSNSPLNPDSRHYLRHPLLSKCRRRAHSYHVAHDPSQPSPDIPAPTDASLALLSADEHHKRRRLAAAAIYLDQPLQTMRAMYHLYPRLYTLTPEQFRARIDGVAAFFRVDHTRAAEICMSTPALILQKSETLRKNLNQLRSNLRISGHPISPRRAIALLRGRPDLLRITPKNLEANRTAFEAMATQRYYPPSVHELAAAFGSTPARITKLARHDDRILMQPAATTIARFNAAASVLGVSPEAYFKAGMRRPRLLTFQPETILRRASCLRRVVLSLTQTKL